MKCSSTNLIFHLFWGAEYFDSFSCCWIFCFALTTEFHSDGNPSAPLFTDISVVTGSHVASLLSSQGWIKCVQQILQIFQYKVHKKWKTEWYLLLANSAYLRVSCTNGANNVSAETSWLCKTQQIKYEGLSKHPTTDLHPTEASLTTGDTHGDC